MSESLFPLSFTAHLQSKLPKDDFIQRLVVPVAPVHPQTLCEDVYDILAKDPALQSIPVIEDRRPVGLVNRHTLITHFAKRYFRDLFGRKPISNIMESSPLVVENTITLDDLSRILVDEEEKYLFQGFIVTREGRYLGMGTGHRLMREITERKQAQLYYLAHHDLLTGLPNRLLFYDRITQALSQAHRMGQTLAVFFVDLDHFKDMNDNHGHPAGDLVIKKAAERLSECTREGDTVARLGGDEFTLILPNVGEEKNAAFVAEKILKRMNEPMMFEGKELRWSCSIGVSLYPDDAHQVDGLIKKADIAVYEAKRSRNTYQLFGRLINPGNAVRN
jgi:diguanylate cyclase